MTEAEERCDLRTLERRFDIPLLAERLLAAPLAAVIYAGVLAMPGGVAAPRSSSPTCS